MCRYHDLFFKSGAFLTLLRTVCMAWRSVTVQLFRFAESSTARARLGAFEKLSRLCKARLSGYSTTLAEDMILLHEGGGGTRRRMAILLRAGEKDVLHSFADLADHLAAGLKIA